MLWVITNNSLVHFLAAIRNFIEKPLYLIKNNEKSILQFMKEQTPVYETLTATMLPRK